MASFCLLWCPNCAEKHYGLMSSFVHNPELKRWIYFIRRALNCNWIKQNEYCQNRSKGRETSWFHPKHIHNHIQEALNESSGHKKFIWAFYAHEAKLSSKRRHTQDSFLQKTCRDQGFDMWNLKLYCCLSIL